MSKNNKNEIIEKIKAKAYDRVNEKIKKEQEETDRKIKSDLDRVEACLELIENQMVFKKVKKEYQNLHTYVIATEEMFLEDYSKNCQFVCHKGIHFGKANRKNWEYLFKVNGEEYYDVNYMIDSYIKDFDDYSKKCKKLIDTVKEMQEEKQELIAQSNEIKRLIKSVELFNTNEILNKFLIEKEDWYY